MCADSIGQSIGQADQLAAQPVERKPASRKGRPKGPKSRPKGKAKIRLKAFWGVYNDLLQRVAIFEYHERQRAHAQAKEWSEAGRMSYFVSLVKEPVE
jgi:hypothetical protein